MRTAAFLLSATALVAAVGIWAIAQAAEPVPLIPLAPRLEPASGPTARASGISPRAEPFRETGAVVIGPGPFGGDVPYILYELEDGVPRTKRLIFRGQGACGSGYPCAAEIVSLRFTGGERIDVSGTRSADVVIVEWYRLL